MNWTWFHKLGSPKWFYQISSRWLPWLAVAAVLLIGTGLVWGLAVIGAVARGRHCQPRVWHCRSLDHSSTKGYKSRLAGRPARPAHA